MYITVYQFFICIYAYCTPVYSFGRRRRRWCDAGGLQATHGCVVKNYAQYRRLK